MSTTKEELSLDATNPSVEEQAKSQEKTDAVATDDTRVEVSEVDNTTKSTDDVRPDWLPNKFKNAEELSKAYSELEKKQSEQVQEAPEDKTYENERTTKLEKKEDTLGDVFQASFTSSKAKWFLFVQVFNPLNFPRGFSMLS